MEQVNFETAEKKRLWIIQALCGAYLCMAPEPVPSDKKWCKVSMQTSLYSKTTFSLCN